MTFTTVGYADMVLVERWRFLSSMTAVNGLIAFGLSTVFSVELIRSVHAAQQD